MKPAIKLFYKIFFVVILSIFSYFITLDIREQFPEVVIDSQHADFF